MKKALLLVALLGICVCAPAFADTISVGNQTITAIGDSIGSDYDQLIFTGTNGTVDISNAFTVGQITFNVGINCATSPCPNSPATGNIFVSVVLNGQNGTLTLPWQVDIASADTFTLGQGTLVAGDYFFYTKALDPVTSGVGSVTQDVIATPEPASMLLLGSGLVGVGGFFRRKLSK